MPGEVDLVASICSVDDADVNFVAGGVKSGFRNGLQSSLPNPALANVVHMPFLLVATQETCTRVGTACAS